MSIDARPGSIVDRRWYTLAELVAAVSASSALVYFVAVSRGWLPGEPPRPSSLLQLASSACLLISFVARRRSWPVAIAILALSVAFLVWSIASVGRGS